jgi:hypothetical protein
MTKKILECMTLLALAALMAGCETMTADECKYANWSDIGMRDGLAGQPVSLLGERVKDCTKAGTPVDTARYMAGREQGLRSFCHLENAVPLGLSGKSYAGVCPALVDIEFRRRYRAGYAVHELRSKLSDLDARGERLQHKLHEADKDEDQQLKASDKDDERKRIRKEFDGRRHDLRKELSELDRATRNTRDALRDAEYSLDNLR